MKKIIVFLFAIAFSTTAFSQKKDKFSIYDLDKKFHFIDSAGKQMNADVIAAYVVKTYNLKAPHKAEHPKGNAASFAVYEFHFTDNTRLFILVRPDITATEIIYQYNFKERSSNFESWDIGSGEIKVGQRTK